MPRLCAMEKYRGHGIGLFSGGLDSSLAVLLIMKQNIKVTALSFVTHFGCDFTDRSSCSRDPFPVAKQFGFEVKLVHLAEQFVEIVRNPKYGHGKNMNSCIDCRILMLREAKKFMELVGADFVFTGEVVGQRPMSQYKPQLNVVARDAGLKGKLVRPLSARILPPTEPELSGILDRDQLENISGRSRKRQMELAAQFGLTDYPNPAGGCLLTDVGYSRRLRDLLAHTDPVDFRELNLLRVGRHFRLDDRCKLIVGRDEMENLEIEKLRRPEDVLFEARETGSPLVLLVGSADEAAVQLAAAITARYCDLKRAEAVNITYGHDECDSKTISVAPAKDALLETIRL
ncbi:MAG: hypothetical protein PHR28_03365 [candidate division Zixibacteria bacterium]|nr:hypothetical protein [candidate division Zixibacteria bacterium]